MTTRKAPGRSERQGMSLAQLFAMFPDDQTAEAWFVAQRWPTGPHCPDCDSSNIAERASRKPQPYRCRDCRKDFSVKTGSVMHGSKLGCRVWALAAYLMTTGIKGTSSMKLHRDLGVTQKTAWFLAHRIREAWADRDEALFTGPVEVDETYIGGKERNKHANKRLNAGRGPVGKTAVVGVRDRASGKVAAAPVESTDARTLTTAVLEVTADGATVFTDEHRSYTPLASLGFAHSAVAHSTREYVRGDVHTNSIESLWALFKRGYTGTYHQMSRKHLHRYVTEFAGRHNDRPMDTTQQMSAMVKGMNGRRLPYATLTADMLPGTVAEPDRSEPW